MNKTKNNNQTKKTLRQRRQNTVKKVHVVDTIAEDASANASSIAIFQLIPSSGTISKNLVLSPIGIQGLIASGASPPTFNPTFWDLPHMPWLYMASQGYQRYRVTNATLVCIGQNTPTDIYGNVSIFSSADAADVCSNHGAHVPNSAGRSFSIASIGTKNIRIPLNIDSSIKKVSSLCYDLGTLSSGLPANMIVPLNSVNDLAFGAIMINITGYSGASGVTPVSFQIEFDVEFMNPISPYKNL